ncbi:MAG: hypothetical protein ACRD1C_02960 [Terriglobales bacterium]
MTPRGQIIPAHVGAGPSAAASPCPEAGAGYVALDRAVTAVPNPEAVLAALTVELA